MKEISSVISSLIFLMAVTCHSAIAAEFSIVDGRWETEKAVLLKGNIVPGDTAKLQRVAAALISDKSNKSPITLEIDTAGGDVEEAMRIGRFLRKYLVGVSATGKDVLQSDSEDGVYVSSSPSAGIRRSVVLLQAGEQLEQGDLPVVYSAGILVFFGGVTRDSGDSIDKRLFQWVRIPVIGVHRPYYEQTQYAKFSPDEAQARYAELDMRVRKYLKEMGAPQSFIDLMFTSPSNEISLIGADEFQQYYSKIEPFLEEWLLAKCGANGLEAVLSPQEQREWEDYMQYINRLAKSSEPPLDRWELMSGPAPVGREHQKVLVERVNRNNRKVNSCKERAVLDHQREWASAYLRQNSSTRNGAAMSSKGDKK